jgi:hypothetical protein
MIQAEQKPGQRRRSLLAVIRECQTAPLALALLWVQFRDNVYYGVGDFCAWAKHADDARVVELTQPHKHPES